jgi:sec-independent protein translocase protein TatB
MLDIGWSEMLMIAVVAIVVIGPKDLPRTLRTIGQWIGKARAVTRDLQNSVNDMVADSELEELRKAGSSIGDFSSGDILNQDYSIDPSSETDQALADDYPTPPPTSMKCPPDEGKADGASDAVAGDTPLVKSTDA